ncbi:MAG: cyclodeaminase/cyclohydrolase family protein [Candidatus Eisenbacteria bacterium]|nr:cyclodeaminase/cyclohydrolase family protein [Candidatus Eisenbacteria bacterium]
MTNLEDFLGELASDSPTPGGGSVAALCGALGAALDSMVASLTVGKKKYADVEEEMKQNLADTESLRVELTQMIEEDAAAFDRVMMALRMPKDTEAQRSERADSLQQSLVDAATIPMAVMEMCVSVIRLSLPVAEKGNANAASDAGVAALVARAGVYSARLNVLINLGGIKSEEHQPFVQKARAGMAELMEEADGLCDSVMDVVLERIS